MSNLPCSQVRHRWGEGDDGQHIEIFYAYTDGQQEHIFLKQPIPPGQPSKTPPAQVGLENGWCQIIAATASQPVSPAPDSPPATSLGSFFLLVLLAVGGLQASRFARSRANPLPPSVALNQQLAASVWGYGQSAPIQPRRTAADDLVDRWHETQPLITPPPETPDFQAVSRLETQMKQFEIALETLTKLIETATKQPEISAETPRHSVQAGATIELVGDYNRLVGEGLSPRGAPIIEALFGLKPGGGSAYKQACELRDQLANRRGEFSPHA